MENFKSTKFVLATMILVGLFILTAMKILDVNKFIQIVEVIYGSFVAGNVVSKFAK